MTQFQYKVIGIIEAQGKPTLEDQLNEFGADGWELVSMQSVPLGTGEWSNTCVLKREAPPGVVPLKTPKSAGTGKAK